MIVTEEEANQLFCHMVGPEFGGPRCQASSCMAWAWYDREGGIVQPPPEKRRGYCGMCANVGEP